MSETRYWTWDYEIHGLGSWPTRPPYAGHTEPVEIIKAEDVRAMLSEIQPLLILVANHIQASNSQSVQAQDLLTRLQEIAP